MTRCALVGLVLFAACSSKSDDYGVGGGGGGGGGGGIDAPAGSNIDAPVAMQDAGIDAVVHPDAAMVSGRVCKLTDPRVLRQCATTGAGGYTVRLTGVRSVLTNADGSFVIEAPSGLAEWVVLGADIVTSHRPFGDYQIPAMPKTMFASLLTANSITPIPGEGTIMADVLKDAIGHASSFAETTPVSPDGELYDTGSEFLWGRTATGADGTIFVPGVVETSTASIKVTPPAPEKQVTVSLSVYDGAITFVTVPIE